VKYVCWIWVGTDHTTGESIYRIYYGDTLPDEFTFIDHTGTAHQLTDNDKIAQANGDTIDIIYGTIFP